MSTSQKKHLAPSQKNILVDYLPAVLKNTPSEGYLIEYHFRNPITNKLVRKRNYVNRVVFSYTRKSDGIRHAQRIVMELNEKLRDGWLPIFNSDDQRLYTPILKMREMYLKDKEKELRHATYIAYSSLTKKLNDWLLLTKNDKLVSGSFKKSHAIRYMDYIMDSDVSNRYYNNNLKAMRAYFTWAVEHCYIIENPFTSIKTKINSPKKRILIDERNRKMISNYLKTHNPHFLLVCQLVYNSAMRPKEIANIRIEDISIDKRHIVVREDNAKNGKARCATITAEAIEYLQKFMTLPGNYYLFGMNDSNMLPAEKRCALSRFRKLWDDMRKVLKLPKEMQLYSLRDTGMVDLLHAGVDELSVQHHFDHSDLSIQARYTNHYDPNLNETIFRNAPKF